MGVNYATNNSNGTSTSSSTSSTTGAQSSSGGLVTRPAPGSVEALFERPFRPGDSGFYFYTPATLEFDHMGLPQGQELEIISRDHMSPAREGITTFVDALTLLDEADFLRSSTPEVLPHNVDFNLDPWMSARNLSDVTQLH
ncbi:unnamed protein product, partial [Amoebophrya sp. A25]|eukprot:GSA25T00021236001.1